MSRVYGESIPYEHGIDGSGSLMMGKGFSSTNEAAADGAIVHGIFDIVDVAYMSPVEVDEMVEDGQPATD